MGFNESVLFRVEADATGVQRGARQAETALQRLQGKYKNLAADATAAGQRTTFYTQSLKSVNSELAVLQVRQAKAAASAEALWLAQRKVNMGLGNASDRALVSGSVQTSARRAIERMRAAESAATVENMRKRVVGAAEDASGGGHGGGRSGVLRESMVLVREISRGNWTRASGSASILIGQLGKLGTVMSMLVNPVTAVIAGLAAGVGTIYAIGKNAATTIRNSHDAGFSTTAYQTVMRQAGRESGGKEGAQNAIAHLSEMTGQARSGDIGAYKKFERYGVNLASASGAAYTNEQVYGQLLQKLEGTTDPAKRAAMAMEFFGENYKKFLKTLDEGKSGLDAAMSKAGSHFQSAGQLAGWEDLKNTVSSAASSVWGGVTGAAGSVWNAGKSAYINSTMGRVVKATDEGEQIDAHIRDMEQSGRIRPNKRTSHADWEAHNPEEAANYKSNLHERRDLQEQLADRGKSSLDTMADEARKMTGLRHRRIYTVTPRMRTSLKIQDTEEQANVAYQRGDDGTFNKLMKQASDMRAANPWLKAMDRNPMKETESKLDAIDLKLADVQKMAKNCNIDMQ